MRPEELFEKPEVPVEVRISDALSREMRRHGVSASRALKLAVYALLKADQSGQARIPDLLDTVPSGPSGATRRLTVRVPFALHDALQAAAAPLTVSAALSRVARLYEAHPEVIPHV